MSKLLLCTECLILAVLLGPLSPRAAAEVQKLPVRKQDPQAQLLSNYRKFPDRYIRILDQSWKYDSKSATAFHSFTLRNLAGVAYSGIELNASYLDAQGKALMTKVLKIPGALPAYQLKKYRELKMANVPEAAEQVLLTVKGASIGP